MTYFYNFGTPTISRKQFKLETSNLASILIMRGTNKQCKTRSKGEWSGKGHVTYFRNLGTPSISREQLELKTSYVKCRLTTRGTSKNAKLGQREAGSGNVTYF